jgi:acetyl-CoA decarbonylase/synthase complex subunit gamma
MDQPFVDGAASTPAGTLPRVTAHLSAADHWGRIRARWGVGRMHYSVDPGLYALGSPDKKSPVLATASYKMSFDCLRRALPGRSAWLLVLDTDGINVWCAAGKGTFGTAELVRRIAASGLSRVVAHRTLILPQLGAPGVAGFQIRRQSGFKVVYGPVRAEDLPAFLDNSLQATAAMRRKTFTTGERAVLVPVELVGALKYTLMALPAFFILSGLGANGAFWTAGASGALWALSALLAAIAAGAVVTPLLLPWLPGRAFALKGLWPGLAAAALWAILRASRTIAAGDPVEILAWLLLIPAASAYLAMNFTGASTYTSRSGVKKEMQWALPAQIAAGAVGVLLWTGAQFLA